MTVSVRTCRGCGEEFSQELRQGRPFVFCRRCRPRREPLFPGAKLDPPVRRDGRCALDSCGKRRKLTKVARRYAGDQLDRDPFCSSTCCRAFHGCPVPGAEDEELVEKRSRAARAQNERRKQEAGIAA